MFTASSLTCGFLFDLDGTLVQTDHLHYSLWETILASYNCPLDQDSYDRRIAGRSDEAIWMEWKVGTREERDQWTTWKESEFLKRIHETIPVPGGKERIQQWNQTDVWIGVVTNSNQKTACALLERLGMLDHLSLLVTSDSKCNPKPSPEPYEWGMEMLGIDPATTVIFEDSAIGLQSVQSMRTPPRFLYRVVPLSASPSSLPSSDPAAPYRCITDYYDPQLDVFLGPLDQKKTI